VLGEAGVNIAQMHNASRGEVAYTLVDVDAPVSDAAVGQIAAVEGILSLRVV
jgi:D-3-phosphoglycerate dehydrogenase / 2-oxoglutarate reductase